MVYPVSVWETRDNHRRKIIRVYELMANEHPSQIPREPFMRDGFRFELAEITRREMPVYSTREHAEVIEVSTQSNDLETVIRLLASTMDFVSDDGYFGVLALDVSSIRIESQGTTSSSHTERRTREFPHLSNSDTSLVPRTITENGRTYNLADVQWRTQSSNAVDYTQVPNTFTAMATYTRTATRTSTIGYTTTAEYRGSISRIAAGRTEFTAQFIGIPVVTPIVNVGQSSSVDGVGDDGEDEVATSEPTPTPEPTPEPGPTTVENVTVEQVHIGGIVIEVEREVLPQDEDIEAEDGNGYVNGENSLDDEGRSGGFPVSNIITVLLFVAGLVLAYFIGKKGKAMLGIFRKASCMLLVVVMCIGAGMAFADTHTVYAASIPGYSFGARGADSSAQANASQLAELPVASQHNTGAPYIPRQTASSRVIHFDPRVVSNAEARASPAMHMQPQGQTHFAGGVSHGFNYGDVIGVLTVERLGRSINVIAGATMGAMDHGAGHFSFTGLNQGNTGLIGHNRGRTNGFFSFVRELREGDILTLEAGGIVRSYAVAIVYVIDESDFSPLMQFSDNRLTLVTCVEYVPGQRRVAKALEIFL